MVARALQASRRRQDLEAGGNVAFLAVCAGRTLVWIGMAIGAALAHHREP